MQKEDRLQKQYERDYTDYKRGKLYIYAVIFNLFFGIYTTIIAFVFRITKVPIKQNNIYLYSSITSFLLIFISFYSVLFSIINTPQEEKYTEYLVETVFYSIPLSLITSLKDLIIFVMDYSKYKKEEKKPA